MDSNGKAVLITGCDSGFGNRLAYRLNRMGFKVYATVLDMDGEGAQRLAKCNKTLHEIIILKMNVKNNEEVNNVYDFVCNDLHANGLVLWALVNNAGVSVNSRIDWGQMKEFENILAINVLGVVRMTRIFMPLLRVAKGRVVNVSSLLAENAMPNLSHYCMSKRAVVSFSQSIQRDHHYSEVKVSTIMPALYRTALYNTAFENMDRVWKDTDGWVRQLYGTKYYNVWKRLISSSQYSPFLSTNTDIVVDDMIDAITSVAPKRIYKSIDGILSKVVSLMLSVLPSSLVDYMHSWNQIAMKALLMKR